MGDTEKQTEGLGERERETGRRKCHILYNRYFNWGMGKTVKHRKIHPHCNAYNGCPGF